MLIPVRKTMDIYTDAMALFQSPDVEWVAYEDAPKPDKPKEAQKKKPLRLRPRPVRKRELAGRKTLQKLKQQQPSPPPRKVMVKKEAAAIGDFTSWSSCKVPLTVVANREHYADGHKETWLLVSTQQVHDLRMAGCEYHLRTAVEERYRQLKCYVNLADFTSRAFSLIVNQVVFVMLAYSLLQHYLYREKRAELNIYTHLHPNTYPRTASPPTTTSRPAISATPTPPFPENLGPRIHTTARDVNSSHYCLNRKDVFRETISNVSLLLYNEFL